MGFPLGQLFALALAAAPPPQVSTVVELAAAGRWDELYLAVASADGSAFRPRDRRIVSGALARGCEALSGEDAVLAYSLAEKSAQLLPTEAGLVCFALAARTTNLREAALAALRDGVGKMPKSAALRVELGRLLVEERAFDEALGVLSKVAPKGPRGAEAERLAAEARRERAAAHEARRQVVALEREAAPVAPGSGPRATTSLTYESGEGPAGLRTRTNARFRFKYFKGDRDFAQRADYEVSVQGALEKVWLGTREHLGAVCEGPVDVMLYTAEEFEALQGRWVARRIAGFYRGGAIHMNRSAQVDDQVLSTLVHEYVHAVIGELCPPPGRIPVWMNEGTAEIVELRFLGQEEGTRATRVELRKAAHEGRLPPLASLTQPLIAERQPGLVYALSAQAVRLMLKSGGTQNLFGLMREVCGGEALGPAIERRYGRKLETLDEWLRDELAKP